jgi:hypothetical protein
MIMNKTFNRRSHCVAVFTIPLLSAGAPLNAIGSESDAQICDAGADYPLGMEDYREAIRLHADVLRRHPENALNPPLLSKTIGGQIAWAR